MLYHGSNQKYAFCSANAISKLVKLWMSVNRISSLWKNVSVGTSLPSWLRKWAWAYQPLSTYFIIRILIASCQTLILACFSKVRDTFSLICYPHLPRIVDHRCWRECQHRSPPVTLVLLPHDILPFSRPKRRFELRWQSIFGLTSYLNQLWLECIRWTQKCVGVISQSQVSTNLWAARFYSVSHFTRKL